MAKQYLKLNLSIGISEEVEHTDDSIKEVMRKLMDRLKYHINEFDIIPEGTEGKIYNISLWDDETGGEIFEELKQ